LNILVAMTILLLVCFSFVVLTYRESNTNIDLKSLENTRVLWLSLALIVVVLGWLFAYKKASANSEGCGAMKYPQLVLGMLAIFMYVGVEVAIGSNLGELLKSKAFGGFSSSEIAPYISMYWGSMMIGRWAGAVSAFNLSKKKQLLLTIVLPFVACGVVLIVNTLAQYDMSHFYAFVACVALQNVLILITKNEPGK